MPPAWSGARDLIVLTIEDVTGHQLLVSQLEGADRQKDEFLAMLAHELRNPLTAISNSIEVWERKNIDAVTAQRARTMAKRQLKHEIGLIDDLLDVSRITRGIVSLKPELVDLTEVVRHGVAAMRSESDAQQHQLSISLPSAPQMVEGDAMRLEQIVTNLLGNAIKYTPPSGKISVSLTRDGDQATLTIHDNGIGMAADLLPTIFTIFVQGERLLDRKSAGLGIGLALVHRLVNLHHGAVRASSKGLGQGSTFVVQLPALSAADVKANHLEVAQQPTPIRPVSSRRILVVDDNADAAESTAILLGMHGHEVEIAVDGPSALLRAQNFRPEVVLLDIGLPDMDGFEVARRLRAISDFADTMLIAYSGYAGEQHFQRVKQAGFDHHLVKPANVTQLNELIASLSDPKYKPRSTS